MTVKDLRELLAPLADDLEVRRHDSEYGAREITEAAEVFGILGRRYMWTDESAVDAKQMCDEGETIYPLVVIR